VAVLAGMDHLPGTTVNRFCASSLQAIRMAAHAVKAGEGDAFLAAGVEAVSRYVHGNADGHPGTENPRFTAAQARSREVADGVLDWSDPRADGELPDIYVAMGHMAENVAALERVSRAEQDAYAVRSRNRAEKGIADGFWGRDITPVTVPDGTRVTADDCPRPGVTLEGVAALKPAFRADGTVTAGNACPLNDGAAAVLVMSEEKAAALGLEPKARIIASTVAAIRPEVMGLGPIPAIKQLLENTKMKIEDIDVVEINEAFAAQIVPCMAELGITEEQLNPFGGAIALGHPFGMTGARIMTTLLNNLETKGGKYGIESMCVAGGMGMAMLVERLS
jgi:acetyl-CoA C-acetyltransferase